MSFWKKAGKFTASLAKDVAVGMIKESTGGKVDLGTEEGRKKAREDAKEHKRRKEEN